MEKVLLPVSLGSEGLGPSLNGFITGSPGTLGLSTYLGFLTGPAERERSDIPNFFQMQTELQNIQCVSLLGPKHA